MARRRIDWMPGLAAAEALEIAEAMWPRLRRQEVIDRLVITGLSALKHEPWQPPHFVGFDRDAWQLPGNIPNLAD